MADPGPETPPTAEVSRRMARVRRRDTKPEVALRSELHARGLRYRVDVGSLPGRPDIVFGPSRTLVQVRGCFWHRCPDHFRLPRKNRDWWRRKIWRNVARDDRTDAQLRAAGWEVVVVWEHEDPVEAADRVEDVVRSRR